MISWNEYCQKKAGIIDYFRQIEPDASPRLDFGYQMMCANLGNFLPQIKATDHLSFFRKLLINQQLAEIEQYLDIIDPLLQVKEDPGFREDLLLAAPGIICTFHTGSYRLIGHYLANKKIPFTLLVSSDAGEREDLLNITLSKYRNSKDKHFKVLKVEERNSIFSMVRELREGRNLLVYIDGNRGSGHVEKNMGIIPFLACSINARLGIAYLAQLAGKPIYPVINERSDLGTTLLKFHAPIKPQHTKENIRSVSLKVTKDMYRCLENLVRVDPSQWEGWLSIHQYAIFQGCDKIEMNRLKLPKFDTLLKFNNSDFNLFEPVTGRYLMEKREYRMYELDAKSYNILRELKIRSIAYGSHKNKKALAFWFKKGVLVEESNLESYGVL